MDERTADLKSANEQLQAEITERRRAEQALRESEERFRSLSACSPAGIFLTDVPGRCTYTNPRCQAICGFTLEESLGEGWARFLHPEDRARVIAEWAESAREGREYSREVRFQPARGIVRWVHVRASPLRSDQGGLIGHVGTVEDITERKQLEEQLRQSQKMEAVGRLAGGVAHDFSNMLTAITGYSELLLDDLGSASPLRKEAEEIKKAAERAASLARQILAFSRRQVLQPRVLDLNSLLGDLDKMLRRLIREDIDLLTVPAPALRPVKADPGQIEQVILNLAVNARDAMPQGGRLIIETADVDLDETYARRHVGIPPGPYVMLAVSDTGSGMDVQTQSRLFEPFFTTKEQGKGTGLGLSTVYRIVNQTGGHIWVYSQPRRGTTFKVYLPATGEISEEAPSQRPMLAELRGSETVLLVEDDGAVRALVRQILQTNGYRVLGAGHGNEALRLLEQHSGPIHLMVTDVVMPGMSGRELFNRLAPLRPTMKVLYMSGYTDNAVVHHGELDPGISFIQKPFTQEMLLRKVREVLDLPGEDPSPEKQTV